MPSGPPDEPRGKVRSALITSSLETCKDSKRGLSPVGHLEFDDCVQDLDVSFEVPAVCHG